MPDKHNNLQKSEDTPASSPKTLVWAGAIVLLLIIFGVPAVLIPSTMQNVPKRSETKAITTYQQAIDIVQGNFKKHRLNNHGPTKGQRRLMPLPQNTMSWIQLINPNGRKAPGGGFAILPQANTETGAIGLAGSGERVSITLPAYRTLTAQSSTIIMGSVQEEDSSEQ